MLHAMRRLRRSSLMCAAVLLACLARPGASAEGAVGGLVRVVASGEDPAELGLTQGTATKVTTPDGRKALCFSGRAAGGITGRGDASFEGRIDLKAKGVDPRDFDLIKIEVQAARAAFLRISLENYPEDGDLSHWYVLDCIRGPVGWTTIWIDLRLPEEIKKAGAFKGMENADPAARGLRIQGSVKDTGRAAQGETRTLSLGAIRFVEKAVDLDWDQTQAPYTREEGGDLVFTYPLTVTNRLAQPVKAGLALLPAQVKHASATLAEPQVDLQPGEVKVVRAAVRLPGAIVDQSPPLYCERFEARAEAVGIPDSTVTLLRSSDPIHLTVTVPIAEEKLQFPLLPLPKSLPANIVRFDADQARARLADDPGKIIAAAMAGGINVQEGTPNSFTPAIVSAAYLYHFTGDKQVLAVAARYFAALPEIWKKHADAWQAQPVRIISSGIVVGNTLNLGWRVGGTQRSPYQYGTGGNEKGGGMSSIGYAFDMIATDLDPGMREKVIAGFFLPAAVQSRNHYIGDGNQQATADTTTLFGGLLARNWPLVSFACSSEHGIQNIIDWTFSDQGLHLRKNYQTYSIRPVLWLGEILCARGIDLYAPNRERLETIVHASSKDQPAFQDQYFWTFVREERLNAQVK